MKPTAGSIGRALHLAARAQRHGGQAQRLGVDGGT